MQIEMILILLVAFYVIYKYYSSKNSVYIPRISELNSTFVKDCNNTFVTYKIISDSINMVNVVAGIDLTNQIRTFIGGNLKVNVTSEEMFREIYKDIVLTNRDDLKMKKIYLLQEWCVHPNKDLFQLLNFANGRIQQYSIYEWLRMVDEWLTVVNNVLS